MGCRGRGAFPFSCLSPEAILSFRQRQGHPSIAVEPRNRKRGEVHGIESLVDRPQAHLFSDQSLAQKHVVMLPGKISSISHPSHQQCTAVFWFRHARWIFPRRSGVHRAGRFQSQRFVRTLFVVLPAKMIERPLLRPPVRRRRRSRFLLQCAMHALVPSILFRMTGRDALRYNPQLHPPHRQTR